MTRIFRYILADDHGIAPCGDAGLVTLATCKPTIRRTARRGDWVMGFRPGSLERGLMLWAGRVGAILPHGEYQRVHPGRIDAVYREAVDGSFSRIDPLYHPSEREKARDLSAPVLIFDADVSRYPRGRAELLPPELAHLAAAGRGHRVNGVRDGDVPRLEAWMRSLPVAPEALPATRRSCSARNSFAPLPIAHPARRTACG